MLNVSKGLKIRCELHVGEGVFISYTKRGQSNLVRSTIRKHRMKIFDGVRSDSGSY